MNAKPAFGRAIVKRIAPGRTAAGLHIPETAAGAEYKWQLVATSEGHTVDGHFVKAEGKPGDYAILGGKSDVIPAGPDIGKIRTIYNTKASDLLPEDHVVIRLHEVETWVPAEAVEARVAPAPALELVKGPVH